MCYHVLLSEIILQRAIQDTELDIHAVIGSGAFGTVYRGNWQVCIGLFLLADFFGESLRITMYR